MIDEINRPAAQSVISLVERRRRAATLLMTCSEEALRAVEGVFRLRYGPTPSSEYGFYGENNPSVGLPPQVFEDGAITAAQIMDGAITQPNTPDPWKDV